MRRSALLNVGGGPVFISTRAEGRVDISLSRSFNPPGPREAFYGEVEHFSRAWSRSGTAWRLRIDRLERIPVVVFPAPVAQRLPAPKVEPRAAGASAQRGVRRAIEAASGRVAGRCVDRRRTRASASDVLAVYFRTDSPFRELFNEFATR
jgi:hypothetical protein